MIAPAGGLYSFCSENRSNYAFSAKRLYLEIETKNKSMSIKVIDKSDSHHYIWGESCDSWVLLKSAGMCIKQERMPEGTKEKLHFHSVSQQFFYILSGSARFFISGKFYSLGEGQGIQIPPGTKHYIANPAKSPLDFLVVSQPDADQDRKVIESPGT